MDVNRVTFRPSSYIKHWGVHLDDSLSFRTHADAAASNGYKCLAQLAGLRYKYKGLSTSTALHIVKTAFLPRMLCVNPGFYN